MRRLARTLLVVTLALFALPGEAREWKKLRIGIDGTYPPFSQKDVDGHPTGFDVEVAGGVCARLGADCEMVALGWDGLLPALLARRVDLLVASLPILEESRRTIEFTARYHRILPRFVARAADLPADTSRKALAGRRIGVRAGTAHAVWLAESRPEATPVPFRNEAEAGAALLDGRVDLVFGDTLALFEWLDRTAPRGRAGFAGDPVEAPRIFGDGAGIAFRRDDRDLGALVDKALGDMTRDGSLDRFAGHWFPFAIR